MDNKIEGDYNTGIQQANTIINNYNASNKPINTKIIEIIKLLITHLVNNKDTEVENFDVIKIGTTTKIQKNNLDDHDLKCLDSSVFSIDLLVNLDANSVMQKSKFLKTANRIYRQDYRSDFIEKKITSNKVLNDIMKYYESIIVESDNTISIEDIKECLEYLVYYAFIECSVLEK